MARGDSGTGLAHPPEQSLLAVQGEQNRTALSGDLLALDGHLCLVSVQRGRVMMFVGGAHPLDGTPLTFLAEPSYNRPLLPLVRLASPFLLFSPRDQRNAKAVSWPPLQQGENEVLPFAAWVSQPDNLS